MTHHRFLTGLKISLWAGAAYDVIFAATMVLIPELAAELMGIRLPGEPFYLWLIAVFLLMLAGFYGLAAYDPVAYRGNILICIAGRGLGFGAMVLGAWTAEPPMPVLYLMAGGDLFFALWTLSMWLPMRR